MGLGVAGDARRGGLLRQDAAACPDVLDSPPDPDLLDPPTDASARSAPPATASTRSATDAFLPRSSVLARLARGDAPGRGAAEEEEGVLGARGVRALECLTSLRWGVSDAFLPRSKPDAEKEEGVWGVRGVPEVEDDSAPSESERERERDVPEDKSQGCLCAPRGVDVARVVPPAGGAPSGGGRGCRGVAREVESEATLRCALDARRVGESEAGRPSGESFAFCEYIKILSILNIFRVFRIPNKPQSTQNTKNTQNTHDRQDTQRKNGGRERGHARPERASPSASTSEYSEYSQHSIYSEHSKYSK